MTQFWPQCRCPACTVTRSLPSCVFTASNGVAVLYWQKTHRAIAGRGRFQVTVELGVEAMAKVPERLADMARHPVATLDGTAAAIDAMTEWFHQVVESRLREACR